jgi:dTDP-4-dehydrorhamnose reductase
VTSRARALVLGSSGLLGSDLLSMAPSDVTVFGRGREVDVTDAAAVARALDDSGATLVINAAAYSAVDRAEAEPEEAMRVNASALAVIGTESSRRGVTVIHFGTDYVFDGESTVPYTEADEPRPINAYGRSKLAGEKALLATGATALIVRTQWLFGGARESFPLRMWRRARRGQHTRVVGDQFGSPTYTVDLAVAVWLLAGSGATGVVNVANSGTASWYDVARVVFSRARRPELLEPCATSEFPSPARRPPYSVLDTRMAARLTGRHLRPWDAALGSYLDAVGSPADMT